MSKEKIVRLLKMADLREKAIIYAMASGGFRLSICLGLRLKHFRDDIFNTNLVCFAVKIPENLNIRTYLIMRQERGAANA